MGTKEKASLIQQGAILGAASLVVRLIGFFYRIILLRKIGTIGTSHYSAAYNIYQYLLILSSLCVPVAISKMVAEKRELNQSYNAYKIFKVSLGLMFFTGSIGTIILWFGSHQLIAFFGLTEEVIPSLKALAPTVLIVALLSSFRGYFQGMKTMVPTATSQVIEQIFNAIFSIVMAFVLMPNGVQWGAAGGTMGTGIGALCGLLFLVFVYFAYKRKSIRSLYKNKREVGELSNQIILKKLIITITPFMLASAVMALYSLIDLGTVQRWIIANGHTKEMAQDYYGLLTGRYVLLTTLPVAIASAMATAAVPNLTSAIISDSRKALSHKINSVMKFALLIAVPSAVGLAVLGKPIVMMLFGDINPVSYDLLRIGSITIVFLAISQVATGILQSINRYYIPARNALIACIIKFVLNYYFIKVLDMNVYGAVISTNIFALVIAVLNVKDVVKNINIRFKIRKYTIKPVIASILMAIYGYLLYMIMMFGTHNHILSTILALICSVVVYGIVLLRVNGITTEEVMKFPFGARILRITDKIFNVIR